MIEWLLKEEEKNKVGRPLLARGETLKKSFYMIGLSLVCVVILSFSFVCKISNKSPLYYLSKYNSFKFLANVNNNNGFIVNNYYKDNKYVIKVSITDKLKSYSGKYRYILYEYKDNSWNECDSKVFKNNTRNFKVEIKQKKNKNEKYKIRLEVTDSSKIDESFAPTGWKFEEDGKNNIKYTYNVFTVSGYYSPIDNKEYKEAKKEKNKVSISTDELNPRKFIIDNKNINYSVLVSYTDDDKKVVNLKKQENITEKTEYVIPSIRRVSTVTFKIWLNDVSSKDVKDYKLSNWVIEKDDGKYYLKVIYKLKPTLSYK